MRTVLFIMGNLLIIALLLVLQAHTANADPGIWEFDNIDERPTVIENLDRMNPGTDDVTVEVRYRNPNPTSNLVQKGQSGAPGGYWKIEFGNPTCLFRGPLGTNAVRAQDDFNDGQWHTVRCERRSNRVDIYVDDIHQGGNLGRTGNIDNDWPLSIGGKSSCEGENVTCDLFSGLIDWVRVSISPPSDVRFPDVLLSNVHYDNIEALAQREITTGNAQGYFRPGDLVTRAQFASFLSRALELEPVTDNRFQDVDPTTAHAPAINAAAEAGIISGTSQVTFSPNNNITRAQVATLLSKALNLPESDEQYFRDVDPDDTHAPAINALAEAGITEGSSSSRYNPNDPIRRDQMASLLMKAFP